MSNRLRYLANALSGAGLLLLVLAVLAIPTRMSYADDPPPFVSPDQYFDPSTGSIAILCPFLSYPNCSGGYCFFGRICQPNMGWTNTCQCSSLAIP